MKSLLFVFLICSSLFAKDKSANLPWKTGTLLDQGGHRSCRIVDGDSVCSNITTFAIDTGYMIYTVSRDRRFRWDKEVGVTVNAPIKYAIVGHKFCLQDEGGKAHEVHVVRKALKASPEPQH
jgi:hypothetical protein